MTCLDFTIFKLNNYAPFNVQREVKISTLESNIKLPKNFENNCFYNSVHGKILKKI